MQNWDFQTNDQSSQNGTVIVGSSPPSEGQHTVDPNINDIAMDDDVISEPPTGIPNYDPRPWNGPEPDINNEKKAYAYQSRIPNRKHHTTALGLQNGHRMSENKIEYNIFEPFPDRGDIKYTSRGFLRPNIRFTPALFKEYIRSKSPVPLLSLTEVYMLTNL
jgi:hypothetical protein